MSDPALLPAEAETVPALINALAAAYGDSVALVGSDGATLSYRELEVRSASLASGLLARGCAKGTRLAILFDNGIDWLLWWAAISRIGAICVPISTLAQPPELARVLRHSDVAGLVIARNVAGHDMADLLEAACGLGGQQADVLASLDAPFLRWASIEGGDQTTWSTHPVQIVSAGDAPTWANLLRAAEAQVHPDDEAITIYTSGQSAEPKGVVHTHRSVLTKVHYLRGMLGFTIESVVEATMPFFWVGGLVMSLFTTLETGGTVLCPANRTPGAALIIGSYTPINPYANLPMAPSLGMTETFGMYAWGRDWAVEPHPVAAPIDQLQPGFQIKVITMNGEPARDGERGELLVRGPSVARRLHKVDQDSCFDADGYYRTGDEVFVQGTRLLFTGRLGDMVKTSGANVSPAEVEADLRLLPGVAAAYVVGVPDAKRGAVVGAAVIPDVGATLDPVEIRAALLETLSAYKVPRRIVVLASTDDLPMTPSMKVRKPELIRMLADTDELT